MLKQIPPTRLFAYLLILGFLPIALVLFTLWNQSRNLDYLQDRLEILSSDLFNREQRQATNLAAREAFRNSDPFFIDKVMETMTFLQPEIEGLKKISANKQFVGDEVLKKRLDYLTGTSNKLIFAEGNVIKGPYFQEVIESLTHPVEVNVDDIKQILANVEQLQISDFKPPENPPQLIVLDFRLDKKRQNEDNDVFLINLKLLKREYLQ